MLCLRKEPGGAEPRRAAVRARLGGAAGAAAGAAPSGRRAGGLSHRRVGVLRPAAGHLGAGAHPPPGHGGAGRRRHRGPAGRGEPPGAGSVRRLRLHRSGGGEKRPRQPCGAGGDRRGRAARLPPEHSPHRPFRSGGVHAAQRAGKSAQASGGVRLHRVQPTLHPRRGHRRAGSLGAGLRAASGPEGRR